MKKNLLRFFLPLLSIVLLSSFAWHKFYVSVTQIDYVPNKKRIEITHRIFIDDLEKALEKRDNYELLLTLVDYYIDAKRDEDAKKILKKLESTRQ